MPIAGKKLNLFKRNVTNANILSGKH